MGEERLARGVEPWLNDLLSQLSSVFGTYLVFEHGSSEVVPFKGGCLTHAHLHLIPYPSHEIEVIRSALSWESLSSMAGLAAYCHLEYADMSFAGDSWLSREPSLPGQ